MFCLNCGAQIPEGTNFCIKCGASVASQPQAVDLNKADQTLAAPMGSMSQPAPQQYAQPPQYGVPQYAPAQVRAPRAPMDPKLKKRIIACAAFLTAFLLVLFLVIIPNAGGKGRLRHIWLDGEVNSRYTLTLDLKNDTTSYRNETAPIISWDVQGSMVTMTAMTDGQMNTVRYYYILSNDGRYLVFFDVDTEADMLDDPDVHIFRRMD